MLVLSGSKVINILYGIKQAIMPDVRLIRSHSILYPFWYRYELRRLHRAWVAGGKCGLPPFSGKQAVVRAFADQFKLKVFIETGTYMGDMIAAIMACFDEVYTIELSQELFFDARRRFQKSPHVRVLHGDSGIVLEDVLRGVDRPCLFWLDGHYSGGRTAKGALEAPIEMELNHIARHSLVSKHVILIDDARCFKGISGYPTIDKLQQWAGKQGFDRFEMEDDIIRIFNSRHH